MAANPENGEGQMDLAILYALEKQAEPAGYWYRQALSLRPDRGDFQLHYAKFLRDSKKIDEAVEIFDRLLQDFPDYIDAHYEAALTYAQLNQPAKAIQSIERVLQLMNPPVLRYYLLAGSLYEANGMKEKAAEAFKNALLLDPQNPEALNGIKRLSE
jgi:Tfp pilus assembly protein PilF